MIVSLSVSILSLFIVELVFVDSTLVQCVNEYPNILVILKMAEAQCA
jgi:hypothetical protein